MQTRLVESYGTPRSDGDYILYWVQSSLFFDYNFCFQRAVDYALTMDKKLWIIFQITPDYPYANTRNMDFLLKGVYVFKKQLQKKGFDMDIVLYSKKQFEHIITNAAAVITDIGHSDFQNKQHLQLFKATNTYFEFYENNLFIPSKLSYPKLAYSAGVFRKPIWSAIQKLPHLSKTVYTVETPQIIHADAQGIIAFENREALWEMLIKTLPYIELIKKDAGYLAAEQQLFNFTANQIDSYNQGKLDLLTPTSNLSAYLHFGHISPFTILNTCLGFPQTLGLESFLEQLVVRRELAFNYMYYASIPVASFQSLPNWAKISMAAHEDDIRPYSYSYDAFKNAQTHDPAWNAAQNQLLLDGYICNYMRMYWAKKIIEWTPTYECALEILLMLNDTYELDGRDANGYVGILWNFGLHDRAWRQRPIFGKLRYMNYEGLRRKSNILAYIEKYS